MLFSVMLLQSKSMQNKFFTASKSIFHSVYQAISSDGALEVRKLDENNFDTVTMLKNRVIVVTYWDEFSADSKSEIRRLEKAMKDLPSKVMLCKVAAGKNQALLKKLDVTKLPSIMIYVEGSMVRSYSGHIDSKHLVSTVNTYVGDGAYGPGRGSIAPIKKDWLPKNMKQTDSQ